MKLDKPCVSKSSASPLGLVDKLILGNCNKKPVPNACINLSSLGKQIARSRRNKSNGRSGLQITQPRGDLRSVAAVDKPGKMPICNLTTALERAPRPSATAEMVKTNSTT